MFPVPHWTVVGALCALCLLSRPLQAEVSPEVVTQVAKGEESLSRLAKLCRGKKYRDAAKALTETQSAINRLSLELSDADRTELRERLDQWERRATAAKRLLDAKSGDGGASFIKEVAPILVTHCSGCHIRESRGGFSVATFEALARGSENGTVLFPGDGAASRLYEVLDTGDMPRGGSRLADDELARVKRWIDEGARFDGPNAAAPISELVTTADSATAKPGMPTLVRPSGQETVSFAKDIAGVLADNCLGCHGGNNPRANLNLGNFAGLLAGGDAGPLFVAGKPADSLLIGKLKGTSGGARMPMGRDPLSDEMIARFEKWIAEGAAFDGGEPTTPLRALWETALADSLSAEELSDLRVAQAAKNWQLALPDTKPVTFEGKAHYIVGNAGEAALKEIAAAADGQLGKIAQALRVPRGQELFKGRITVFVFQKRVEYTEFAQLVEQRGVPQDITGHWRFSRFDPYICVVLPADVSASFRPQLSVQLTGLGIASLAQTPRWFSQGLARAVAARLESKDSAVRTWDSQVPSAVSSLTSADLFLGSDGASGSNAMAAYGFAKVLLDDGRRYGRLLAALRDGQEFDASFTDCYGTSPKSAFESWAGIRQPQ